MGWPNLNRKLVGITGIAIGLSTWGFVFFADKTKLILSFADSFLIKYFVVIAFLDAGLFFIACGIVALTGTFNLDRYDEGSAEYDVIKAKGTLLGILLTSPFFVSFLVTALTLAESAFWRIAGIALPLYCAWSAYRSIKKLLNTRKGG